MSTDCFVVTGASRGMGRTTVLALAALGHPVWALSRSLVSLEEQSWPNGVMLAEVNPIDALSRDKWLKELQNKGHRVQGLVNNAGLLLKKPFEALTMEDFSRSMEVNVTAPAVFIQSLLPHLTPTAHVINISSMGGFQGASKFPGMAAYSSSKAALVCLTEVLQVEYAHTGWAFNALCLGSVQTEMLAEAFPGYVAPNSPEAMGAFIADFVVQGHRFFKGKVLPVSSTTP